MTLYAIRGKGKVSRDYGLTDIFKLYKNNTGILNYSKFSKLVRELNEKIGEAIVLDSLELEMPALGTIRVKKFQTKTQNPDGTSRFKKLKPNWAETKKLWQRLYPNKTLAEIKEIENKPIVRHLNEHSQGYSYEFYYNKNKGKYKNKTVYSFVPARGLKNMLSAAALNPDIKVDYYE